MLRRVFKSCGTIDWRIDWRERRYCSGDQTVRSQPMKLADPVMRRRVNVPRGAILRSRTVGSVTLWERSPDRDFPPGIAVGRPLLQGRGRPDASPLRQTRCASEAVPIIVESRLVAPVRRLRHSDLTASATGPIHAYNASSLTLDYSDSLPRAGVCPHCVKCQSRR